jgi:hypothetical protein
MCSTVFPSDEWPRILSKGTGGSTSWSSAVTTVSFGESALLGFRSKLSQVTFEGVDVGTELAHRPLGRTVVDVHVLDGREVDPGAVELPDGRPEDLTQLA